MKASIIIRVYNSEKTIERAILSALEQNFSRDEFEIIAVNDGSSDKTKEILHKFEGEKNFLVIDQENQGPLAALGRGIKESGGIYLTLLDADDSLESGFLRSAVSVLDMEPEIDFVYADYYEHEGDSLKIVETEKNLFNTIAGGILYRKNSLEKVGYWRNDIPWPEYDLFLRTIDTWKGKHISGVYYHYFRQPHSLTRSNREWSRKSVEKLKELHPDKLDLISKIRDY